MKIVYPSPEDVIEANKKAIELLRATKAERHELLVSKKSIETIIKELLS